MTFAALRGVAAAMGFIAPSVACVVIGPAKVVVCVASFQKYLSILTSFSSGTLSVLPTARAIIV